MADEKLRIILDAFFKGKGEVQKAQKEISKLEQASAKAGKAFKMVGGAALVAAGAFAAVSIAALKEGAALELVSSKFDALTASIGTTSDALLNDMKKSSSGMVSDAQLVAGAVELMSGKLATSHDAVVRLSNVSTQLGWDMGVLAQTINNQSVLRLDNLGVAVSDVIPKFEELKKSGMDVKAAFTEALTSAGEAKLELLGSKAETTAGKIQQIITVGENAKDAFAQSFAVSLADQMEDLSGSIQDSGDAIVAFADTAGQALATVVTGIQQAMIAFIDLQIQLAQFQQRANIALPDWALADPMSTRRQDAQTLQNLRVLRADVSGGVAANTTAHMTATSIGQVGIAATQSANAIKDLGAATNDAATAQRGYDSAVNPDKMQAWNTTMIMSRSGTESMREILEEAEGAATGFGGGLASAADDAALLEEEMRALASATGDYFMEARRAKDFNPFESLLEAADKYGANALQLAGVGVAGGLFDEGQAQEYLKRAALMQRADMLGQAIATGQITAEQAASMLGGLKEGFDSGQVLADEFFAGINEQELMPQMLLNTQPGWDDYLAVKQRIESNPPTVVVRVVNAVAAANADNIRGPIE